MLNQYGLKANDAILAEEKHMGIYEDREWTPFGHKTLGLVITGE